MQLTAKHIKAHVLNVHHLQEAGDEAAASGHFLSLLQECAVGRPAATQVRQGRAQGGVQGGVQGEGVGAWRELNVTRCHSLAHAVGAVPVNRPDSCPLPFFPGALRDPAPGGPGASRPQGAGVPREMG